MLPPAQLKPLQSKVNQDQMDQEEQPNTILIWPNVFIADFVKLLAQLMLSFKDQTFKTLPLPMNSSFTAKKNCLKMETDGNHNLPETLNLKSEVDSLLIDIFLFFSQQIFFYFKFQCIKWQKIWKLSTNINILQFNLLYIQSINTTFFWNF